MRFIAIPKNSPRANEGNALLPAKAGTTNNGASSSTARSSTKNALQLSPSVNHIQSHPRPHPNSYPQSKGLREGPQSSVPFPASPERNVKAKALSRTHHHPQQKPCDHTPRDSSFDSSLVSEADTVTCSFESSVTSLATTLNSSLSSLSSTVRMSADRKLPYPSYASEKDVPSDTDSDGTEHLVSCADYVEHFTRIRRSTLLCNAAMPDGVWNRRSSCIAGVNFPDSRSRGSLSLKSEPDTEDGASSPSTTCSDTTLLTTPSSSSCPPNIWVASDRPRPGSLHSDPYKRRFSLPTNIVRSLPLVPDRDLPLIPQTILMGSDVSEYDAGKHGRWRNVLHGRSGWRVLFVRPRSYGNVISVCGRIRDASRERL
ncbi:hypothetical protein BOTBODRAFT_177260 [Botryobasidium botryosum FD-172 SS1]|uniref:Uncharacterized protein n=1 Tax=Botryobasidium botryosum (strain FD-172 SS1) TaxID=930990 RepID=A0A067MHR9_BOTB1|nr:hypothetical protein BOTBODRAFT_177260 [Botryobasidium botryosum FD-172 SS1]